MDILEFSDRILQYTIPFVIFFLLILAVIAGLKRKAKMGSLKLASRKKACGIIFGLILTWRGPKVVYSPINAEGSVIVWGTSGAGKTSSILRNTINSIKGSATTFAIDISGDIVSTIIIKNKIVFGPNAENSAAYSVFAPVDRIMHAKNIPEEIKRPKVIEQLIKIASQMIPILKDGEAEGGVVFFNNGAHDIIAASLIAGYFDGMDFCDICLSIYKHSWRKHFEWIDRMECEEASDLLGQFEGIKDEHKSGCMGTAKSTVQCIASNTNVRSFLHRPKQINGVNEPYYTPRLLEKYSVFYVVNDGEDFDLYAPLTRLVISQTMEYLQNRDMKKANHTILLTLDEYSSLNMAKETTAAAKKYRKKKVRLLVLTQSIADMDLMTRQGNTASRATIDNFPYLVVMAAQDPESQLYFANMLGKHEVAVKDSQGNYVTKEKYWINPPEFRKFKHHFLLIHDSGHMILGKCYYHMSTLTILIKSFLNFSIRKWGIFQ